MIFGFFDWLIFLGVPVIAWVIGSRSRGNSNSWRGYFLARGNLNTTSVAAVYFGANLTFTTIFLILSEETYMRGPWVFSVPIFWVVGTIVFIYVYPWLKPFINHGMTLHQALGGTFQSRSLQRWASLWTILAFVGTVTLEFYGGIRLLQWTHLPLFVDVSLALLLAFVVGLFTVTGGFRGIAAADIFLDIVALAGTVLLLVFMLRSDLSPTLDVVNTSSLLAPQPALVDNIFFAIGMGIIFIPFQLCTLDTWQRLGGWQKRNESPKKWLLSGSILLALAYCVPILIGMHVRSTGAAIPIQSHALKVFLDNAHITPGLLGLVFAGFVAAIFSTADELLNCCGLSLLFDTFQIQRDKPERSEVEEMRLVSSGKFYTTLFGFVSAMIALLAMKYGRQISDISLAVFSGQVVFTLPLIFVLFAPQLCPRLARAAMASMLFSFVAAIVAVIIGWVMNAKVICDAAPLLALSVGIITFGPPAVWVVVKYRRGA